MVLIHGIIPSRGRPDVERKGFPKTCGINLEKSEKGVKKSSGNITMSFLLIVKAGTDIGVQRCYPL
jgi:hypothetical protein